MTTILIDPSDEGRTPMQEPAPRLDGLAGHTIALLDISKPRGDVFLDTIEHLLVADGATVRRFAKPTFTKPAPADLRHEIATTSEAVIEALAD